MAISEVLRIVVDADARGAVRGINDIGRATDRELGRSQKTIDQWSRGLTTAGTALIGVGSAALFGLGAAAMASEQANLATVKLENTLQNMPKLAGESSEQFIDLAESIQDVTAADADAIVEAEALLGTFNLTADEIKRITPLVVDYARKFGVDLPSAATQVGKALDGNIGALKRVGISIDETAFAADRFGAVQSALADQVGGFAEAEGATFAGSLERLKNQLGDVAEGVGTGAVDAFSSMFGVVEGLTDRFQELSPETQNIIGQFATFASVGAIGAGGLSLVIGQVLSMQRNFSAARSAISDFIGAGGLGGLAKTVAKGGILITALVGLEELLDSAFGENTKIAGANLGRLEADLVRFGRNGQVTGELLNVVGEDFDNLKDALGDIDLSGVESARASVDRFASSIPLAGRALGTGFAKDVDEAKRTLDDFDKALASIAQNDPDQAFGILKNAARELGVSVDELMPALDDYDAAVGNVAAASELSGVSVDEFGRSMDDSADSTEEATTALERHQQVLAGTFDPVHGMITAQQGLRDAQVSVTDAQHNLNEALAAGDPTAIAEAQRDYEDAVFGAQGALVSAQSAQLILNDAVSQNPALVDRARLSIFQWAINAGFSAEQAQFMADQMAGATAEAQRLDSQNVNVPLFASDFATPNIRQVDTELENLDGKSATVTIKQLFTTVGNLFFGGQRAHGGPVSGGRLYEVAEQGRAELLELGSRTYLIPGSDGTVVPAGQFAMTGAGGGSPSGGGVTHVHEHIYVQVDGSTVAEANRSYKRNNGLDWRS